MTGDMRYLARPLAALAVVLLAVLPSAASAQDLPAANQEAAPIEVSPNEYLLGTAIRTESREIEGSESVLQELVVLIDEGEDAGREIAVVHGGVLADPVSGVKPGDRVVLVRSVVGGEETFYLADRYRLPWIYALAGILVIAAIAVGGRRGAAATLGLAASIGIFAFVIIPQLTGGISPVLVVLLGGVAIATVTTFLGHGVSRDSAIVLGSIVGALLIGTLAAVMATWALSLSGLGSEEAISLSYGPLAGLDLKGLLVASVLLGCLGVLDDVAATQVATVREIADANPLLTARDLYRRGMRVGAHHVAALINTLFLAYAGAALPLLLVGLVNLQLPVWAFLNTEAVSEEIVRTAVGSGSLVLAVPIATALTSWLLGAKRGLQKTQDIA